MSITNINAGQAAVQIIGDNSKLKAALDAAHGSLEQFAAGMASLGMMGFSPTEINGAMESVMALSRATSTVLAEAASIAANQLRVFGMSAADTEKVADILAATTNGSAQTLTDLGEALHYGGSPAAF